MQVKPKKTVFEFYTFQLVPTATIQLDLFSVGIKDVKELRERKNEIFLSIITDKKFHFTYKGHKLKHKILWNKGDYLVFRVANVKSLKAEKEFREVYIENEPSIIVAINNNPKRQEIAIESDLEVFTTSEAVASFIQKSTTSKLSPYSLNMEVNNQYSSTDFWKLVGKHQNQIRYISIELVRENLSDIYKTISQELVDYGEFVNAEKTIVTQQAANGSVLENINKENKQLNGFVEASSKGAGPIKMKLLGMRHTISTKDQTTTKEIDVAEIDNMDEKTLLKVIDKLFK